MADDVFSLSCLTCVTTERVAPEDAADLVGALRAFFIRHGGCVTNVDLRDPADVAVPARP